MNDIIKKRYPLDEKIQNLLKKQDWPEGWKPSGVTRDFYLELSRPIVKMALAWQDETGRIIDPFARKETPTANARFVGACAGLIQSGRDDDLVEPCALSMDRACEDLYTAHLTNLVGPEFYVKELMLGYVNLRDKADKKRVSRWKQCLADYDPEKTYAQVLSKCAADKIHNFCTFAMAGEAFKAHEGLVDNEAFIDRYLDLQKNHFTEFGMYRDPNDPMTYDWVARMNLTLMMEWGYRGKQAAFVDEMLRRGALTGLLFTSSTGEAPYGGRSNQQNFNEATLALICEYEARRYARLGNRQLAGMFKRTAHLAIQSIRRWLTMNPVRFTKNEFLPESEHGRESGYGYYAVYSLLIASQLGVAYRLADDTIPETPAFCETGGFMLNLPDAFHKIFATGGGYHVEIDTRADLHYDATGLGRIHRAGIPTELGLSIPIPAHPNYILTGPASIRNAAMGPGWTTPEGKTFWLSDLSEEIVGVEVTDLAESPEKVQWSVAYTINMGNRLVIRESYCITRSGLEVTSVAPDTAEQILAQIPLLETDGARVARIREENRAFVVDYAGCSLRAECVTPVPAEQYIESFPAPNRNGIYRIGCFKAAGRRLAWRLSIQRTG